MIIELTKKDNDIIIQHLYKYNEGVENHMKMVMDSYIEKIEFNDNDIIFHSKRIKPILDYNCGIGEDNVGQSKGEIGQDISIKISEFEKPYDDILNAAIREIKLNKLI